MTLTSEQICSLSVEHNSSSTLEIFIFIIFAVYIFFDSIIGALTVGAKSCQVLIDIQETPAAISKEASDAAINIGFRPNQEFHQAHSTGSVANVPMEMSVPLVSSSRRSVF